MSRIGRLGIAMTCALMALSVFAPAVSADRLWWNVNVFQNCVGTTATHTLTWGIARSTLGAGYKNGQLVKFAILSVEQPLNGTMSATLTDRSIKLPANWRSLPYGYVSLDTVTLQVTFTATKQFTDGGRVRLVANGNLESVDVPTNVPCSTPSAAAPKAHRRHTTSTSPRTPKVMEPSTGTPSVSSAPVTLSAGTDYFYTIDPGIQGPHALQMNVRLNDVGPKPGKIRIVSTGQLRAPMSIAAGGSHALSKLGTVSIRNNGQRLQWTDDRCAIDPSLCSNLPALFFNYTISDGTSRATGRVWIKFDRPWTIPFGFDPGVFLVPPAIASLVPAGLTLPVLVAKPTTISGLPGIKITVLNQCPSVVDICHAEVDAIVTGADISKEVSAQGTVTFQQPIVVQGGELLAGGSLAFPIPTPDKVLRCHVDYVNLGGSNLSVPYSCEDYFLKVPTHKSNPVVQQPSIYITTVTGYTQLWDGTPADGDRTAALRKWCLMLTGFSGSTRSTLWKDTCASVLSAAEMHSRWP